MKKLIFIIGLFISFVSFGQDAEINELIIRDRIIMTDGKIIELSPGIDSTDAVNVSQLIDTVNKYSFVQPIVSLQFDTVLSPSITPQGMLWWNGEEYTLNIETGLGPTIQVGQEILLLYYNDTGVDIDNFSVLHPKSAILVSGIVVPTPDLADASVWELSEGTLAVATQLIPNGQLGFAVRFGKARAGNTSAWSPGSQLWLSTTPGELTDVKPIFPDYSISMGGNLNQESAPDGEIFVSITKSVEDTYNDAWDGAIRETFSFSTSSNGTVVTGLLENADNTRNLTLLFSDGFYTLDVTPGIIDTLTPGTDEATQTNYVYVPIATKAITVSTSGFPTTEHCKIAKLEVQSALNVQAVGGVRKNQNYNDHIKLEDDNGHILHIAEWIRRQFATWGDIGCEATFDATAGNGYVSTTAGKVSQLHLQDVTALSMPTVDIMVANDPDVAFVETDNLNTITKFSDGSVWNNKWGKIVVWLIANKTGEPDFLCVNLPRAGETSSSAAILDGSLYADYSIPAKYKSNAILVGAFAINITSGTVTYSADSQDLRGTIPSNIAGGSGGGGGGVTTYLGLTDTPSSFTANAFQRSNAGATALENVLASAIDVGDFTDDGTYWKNDGTSTATGAWDIGSNSFTSTGLTSNGDVDIPTSSLNVGDGTGSPNIVLNKLGDGISAILFNNSVTQYHFIRSVGNETFEIGSALDEDIAFYTNNLLSGKFSRNGEINWDHHILATNFISNVATGTQPYATTSTTLNTNLNADLLDGQEGTYYLDYNNFTNTTGLGTEGQIPIINATDDGYNYTDNFKFTEGTGNFFVSGRINGSDLRLFDESASKTHIGNGGTFWVDNSGIAMFTNDNTTYDLTASGGGGAPIDVNYLVGTADATLTNEIVVGTTPGGDLGNTWASPSVDNDSHNHTGSTISGLNLSTDASGGNWKVLYSNGTGIWTELALGSSGTFLGSNGATSAPSFSVPPVGGDVSKVGTPVDNQVGVWTGDGTIAGTNNFKFIDSSELLQVGTSSSGHVNTGFIGFTYASPAAPASWVGSGGFIWSDSDDDKLYYTTSAATYDLTASGGSAEWTLNSGLLYPNTYATTKVLIGQNAETDPFTNALLQMTGKAYFSDDLIIQGSSPTFVVSNHNDAYISINYDDVDMMSFNFTNDEYGGSGATSTMLSFSYDDFTPTAFGAEFVVPLKSASYITTHAAAQSTSGTINIDTRSNASSDLITITGAATVINFNYAQVGQKGSVLVRQDAEGGRELVMAAYAGNVTSSYVDKFSGGLVFINPDPSSFTEIEYTIYTGYVVFDVIWVE